MLAVHRATVRNGIKAANFYPPIWHRVAHTRCHIGPEPPQRGRAEGEPWAARSAVPLAAASRQQDHAAAAAHVVRPSAAQEVMEVNGNQVGVKGAYWDGRQTDEEKACTFMCSVVDYSISHKFRPSEPPMAAFRMQEMGQTGTGSTEHGDSSGDLFWMPYPDPFLT